MLKRILFSIAAAAMALPFLQATPTQAATKNVDIVVHKRMHDDARLNTDEWSYENNGSLKSRIELEKTKGLNGAEVVLYDATKLYQEALADGKTPTQFVNEWRNKDRMDAFAEAEEHLALLATKTTQEGFMEDGSREDGIARFTVAQKVGSQYAAYLLLEKSVASDHSFDVDLSTMAAPMMVVMPIMNADGAAMDNIHIYAKNVAYVRDPYFFKFGRNAAGDDVRVQGAVFALYQIVNGEKLWLSTDLSEAPRNEWITSSNPLTDEAVDKFISDQDGLVNTGTRFLASGTYYFEELKPALGYINNLGATGVKVEVPTSWTKPDGSFNPVLVNGEVLDETTAGVVSDAQIAIGRPRVYNIREKEDQGNVTVVAKPSTPQTPAGKLPQTGSVISGLLIALGAALMLGAWLLQRRAHTKN